MRDADWTQSRWPWPLRMVEGIALSSTIVGLATTPIAAARFNQIPNFGLVANILSVPLMSAIIIPSAVLWPFGLEWIGLKLMDAAITWILTVADKVVYLPESLSHISSPTALVLPLLTLGCLWIVL